jgi:citrate synthase
MFAKEGLEGVVAARTSISLLKGTEGVLEYRGYSIDDLVEHAGFEEVAYLLWHGELPAARELSDLCAALAANPDYAPAHFELGLALQEQGKREEARQEFQRANALDPHFTLPAEK